jgi:arylsulfatase A-like enzyme
MFGLQRFVVHLAIPCLSLLLSFKSGQAQQPTNERRPNILFIYTDDQSYKTLGCYDGSPDWVKTPNIDRLASQGVQFQRSYLGAWCMPSRASLLTGRLQHGVMSMTMDGEYPGSKYDPVQCPFIPAQFRAQGYTTAQIGKWHTGTDTGFGRDWDYQIVWNRPGKPDNAGNYYADQVLTFNGVDRKVEGYSTDNYTRWATEYIQGMHRDASKPWYLWLCYGAVHGPTTPARRHQGQFRGKTLQAPSDIVGPWPDKPAYLNKTAAWTSTGSGFAMGNQSKGKDNFDSRIAGTDFQAWVQQVNECMLAVDEGVGQVLKALEASGQLENTLIIFTADQGYGLGEHGFNQKVAPYDATIASPMIMRWVNRIPEGRVCKHPINSPDLVDFLCRSAQVSIPWRTHGRDIRPLLEDPQRSNWNAPMLMTHTGRNYGAETDTIPTDARLTSTSDVPWYALLRDGKYKYIRTLVERETEELYDLETDPEELTNLAMKASEAGRLTELRAKTVEELRRTDARFADRMPQTRAEASK